MTDITIVNQQITATITEPDQISVVVTPPSEVLVTLEYAQGPGGSGGSGGGGATVSTDIIDFVEAAQDATGEMVSGNTEDGLSVTYSDTTNKLNFTNTDKGSVAVSEHELATDPHPQYTTETEVQTISNSVATTAANAAVDAHELEADPHPQYQTQTEGDARYSQLNHTHVSTDVTDFVEAAQDAAGAMVTGNNEDGISVTYDDVANKLDFTNTDKGSVAVATHEAASDPHPQYLTQTEGDAAYNVQVLDENVSLTTNLKSLNFIGAGVTSSSTPEGAVTVTVNGGGGGGGSYDLTQLAVDVDGLPLSTPLADDFDINLRDGSTPTVVKVPSVVSEVIIARGSRDNLNNRISTISSLAGTNIAPPVLGRYYDNAFTPAPLTGTVNLSTNRFTAVSYVTPYRWRIDRLGFQLTTAATSGLYRCFIYASNPSDLMPTSQLFVGALELDVSTTGFKEHILDFIFEPDVLYWIGLNGNFTGATAPAIRSLPAGSGKGFGPVAAGDTSYRTGFAKTGVTSTDPLPVLAPVVESDLIALGNQLPLFRMRAAAL